MRGVLPKSLLADHWSIPNQFGHFNTSLHAQTLLECGPGAQMGMNLAMIPCEDVTIQHVSPTQPQKAAMRGEFAQNHISIPLVHSPKCGTLTHSNTCFDRYSNEYNNVYLSMLLCIYVFQVEGKMSSFTKHHL